MIRVMSYNVRSLRDSPAAVARVVRANGPDLLCLQEVPRFGRWRAARDELARACGMTVLSSRRTAGLAVLGARGVRLLRHDYHLLTWSPPLHRRALAVAEVEVGGRALTVASAHLDLVPGARLKHGKEILALLGSASSPLVLAGDFNEQEGGDMWSLLTGVLQDAYRAAPEGDGATFPSWRPGRRIDAVFVDRELRVEGCGVPPDTGGDHVLATDHLPLLARLTGL